MNSCFPWLHYYNAGTQFTNPTIALCNFADLKGEMQAGNRKASRLVLVSDLFSYVSFVC